METKLISTPSTTTPSVNTPVLSTPTPAISLAPADAIAVLIGGELCSLHELIHPGTPYEWVSLDSEHGRRAYRRSLCFIASMSDESLVLEHSLGDGFFFRFDTPPAEGVEARITHIKDRMAEIVAEDMLIMPVSVPYHEMCAQLEADGVNLSSHILNFRNDAYVAGYLCGEYLVQSDDILAPRTGLIDCYEVRAYQGGILLRYPSGADTHKLTAFVDNPVLFDVFKSNKAWGHILKVQTVGELNKRILEGSNAAAEFVRISESLQERRINLIADAIAARKDELKVIFVAGPSSSGKTTFLKKLSLALKVLGMAPVGISLDDYYKNRDEVPLLSSGKPDLECLESLQVDRLKQDLATLLEGKEIYLPVYDFASGMSSDGDKALVPAENSIYILEGIHGLSPRLSEGLPEAKVYKIFISALTQLRLDKTRRISTTDNRLLRRMVRDNQFRGTTPQKTLEMWADVREGEKKYIFPYQNQADMAFNSALDYELAVLKFFADPLLRTIKPGSEHYATALRLLSFLDNFSPIHSSLVPRDSLLREFIGGLVL